MIDYGREAPSVDDVRLGFGMTILNRVEAIREDIEAAGVHGVLSLIQALIVAGDILRREDILQVTETLLDPVMYEVVDELLDHFEGDDPRRHLWSEDCAGIYCLTGHHLNEIH